MLSRCTPNQAWASLCVWLLDLAETRLHLKCWGWMGPPLEESSVCQRMQNIGAGQDSNYEALYFLPSEGRRHVDVEPTDGNRSNPNPKGQMKHSLLSIRASAVTRLAWLVWSIAAITAHAQPGPGYALRFNDNASYVAVPQAVGLNSFPFTVMAWVNTSVGTGQQ